MSASSSLTENRFKMGISRMFRGSFGSCRPKNLSDVIEKAVFIPQNEKNFEFKIIEALSSPPKTRPFPSICRPKCPDSSTESASIISRQKVSARYLSPLISAANANGRTCPPASPISSLNPFYKDCSFNEAQKGSTPEKNKKKKKKKKKKKENNTHLKGNYRRDTMSLFSSTSREDSQYYGGSYWFSSDEDGEKYETDAFFSSRSLSSESSGSRRRHRSRRENLSSSSYRRNKASAHKGYSSSHEQMGALPLDGSRVKGSFALVKSSSDPYNDFRTSMVEMIVEKRIFAAKDLEQLLQCFLSLNSYQHHGTIVEVFAEILETLFSS